ncbi:MAG: toxin-activating lysine-acyltransferase [Hyphomicrobiaceae bacterium]
MALWSKKTPTTPGSPAGAAPSTPPPVQPAAPSQQAGSPGPAPAATPAEELSEEARRNAMMLSKSLMAAFGQITTILMRTTDYRGKTLADLEWLAAPAVTTGQFAVLEAQSKANGMTAPVGLLMWAFVSPEVDQRLRKDPNQPIKLEPKEWKSGDILWVVEAIGEASLLQAMLQNAVAREWRGRPANLRVRQQDGSFKIALLKERGPGEQPPT